MISPDSEEGKLPDDEESFFEIELKCDEYLERFREGTAPSIEKFAESYPDLKDGILELLPTIMVMEQARDRNYRKRKDGRVQSMARLPDFTDFEIIKEIGRGGMGIVYEARQVSLDRRVAIKVLPKNLLGTNEIIQFGREAATAAKLHHTNIAPIYAVGENKGTHFFAMQLLDGSTLDSMVKSGHQFSADEVISIGRQVASALQYAHEQEVYHRDIKPGNLIRDQNSHVWVTDFGLAISRENRPTGYGNKVSGTLRYMPPESLTESPNETKTIDSAAGDIYALGITLIELMTGRPAFEAEGTLQLVDAIRSGAVTAFQTGQKFHSKEFEAVLRKTVAVDPQDRYRSAEALEKDLENIADGRGVTALPPSIRDDLWRWSKRNSALAAVSLVAAVLLYLVSVISSISYFRIDRAYEAQLESNKRLEETSRIAEHALGKILDEFAHSSTFSDQYFESNGPKARVSARMAAMVKELAKCYNRLASQNRNDPEFVVKALEARSHAAEIYERLGEYSQAAEFFEQTLYDYQALIDSGKIKFDSVNRFRVARIRNQLGKVINLQEGPEEAAKQHHQAIKILEETEPYSDLDEQEILLELAYSHYLLGYRTRPGMGPNSLPPPSQDGPPPPRLGDVATSRSPKGKRPPPGPIPELNSERRDNLEKCLEILEGLKTNGLEFVPETDSPCMQLAALAYRELVPDNRMQWEPTDREKQVKAIDLLESLVAAYPANILFRFELMKTLAELDVFHLSLDDESLSEADNWLRHAIELGEELVAEQPDIADYQIELAHAHFKLGVIAGAKAAQVSGNSRDELLKTQMDSFRRALSVETFLSRQHPDSLSYRVWIARFSLSLASCEAMQDRSASRSRLIERAYTLLTELPDDFQKKPEVVGIIREAKTAINSTLAQPPENYR